MERNRFSPPLAVVDDVDTADIEYVGFWPRVGASLIDAVILVAITYPLLAAVYGLEHFTSHKQTLVAGPVDILISWVFPFIAVVLFWHYKRATPGKMVIGAQVVDVNTGEALSFGRCITRYLAAIIASLPLGIGLLWVAFDRRKQGWHDKIAGSVVIVARRGSVRARTVPPEV